MTSLATAILLTLTVLVAHGAAGCDSNPVPHPGQESTDKGNDAFVPGVVTGEADGSTPPGRTDDNDQDPSTDFGEGGTPAEPCTPDADIASGADAGDAADEADADVAPEGDASDDNATDTVESSDADCGPSEVQPPASGAADQVEE